MNLVELRDLYRHMEWADASVWRAVFAAEEAIEDKQLAALFYHLHLVQHVHLRAWQGRPIEKALTEVAGASFLLAWGSGCSGLILDHLKQLNDSDLAKLFPNPWPEIVSEQLGRTPEPITLGEMMMQVPLHSLYHRGQINLRLRKIGGEPPTVDYIVWCWLGKPAADWSWVRNEDR